MLFTGAPAGVFAFILGYYGLDLLIAGNGWGWPMVLIGGPVFIGSVLLFFVQLVLIKDTGVVEGKPGGVTE